VFKDYRFLINFIAKERKYRNEWFCWFDKGTAGGRKKKKEENLID